MNLTSLTTKEVAALFDLDEGKVRKEVEHGVIPGPPRFTLGDATYLCALGRLGFELGVADRKRLREEVVAAVAARRGEVPLGSITCVRIDAIVRDLRASAERFMTWKGRLVTDERILGGEPVFPHSRLAVRQIGGMRLRGASVDDLREDYPYLTDEDVELAARFTRAYPKMGRPGVGQTAAR